MWGAMDAVPGDVLSTVSSLWKVSHSSALVSPAAQQCAPLAVHLEDERDAGAF